MKMMDRGDRIRFLRTFEIELAVGAKMIAFAAAAAAAALGAR